MPVEDGGCNGVCVLGRTGGENPSWRSDAVTLVLLNQERREKLSNYRPNEGGGGTTIKRTSKSSAY